MTHENETEQLRKTIEEMEVRLQHLINQNQGLKAENDKLQQEALHRKQKLIEQEREYQRLINNVGDIIFKCTPDGTFTFVNQVAVDKTGYSHEELLRMKYLDLLKPDHTESTRSFFLAQMSKAEPKSYFEFPIITKDGREIWIGQNTQFQFEAGVPTEIFAIARDITAFKNAHDQLSLSEEKYRSIIENLELGLLETDRNGIVTKIYPKFTQLTGYTANDLLGKDPKNILLGDAFEVAQLNSQEALRRSGIAGAYESSIIKKSGERIWVLISAAPIQNRQGEVTGSIGVHFDITERKKIEKELRQAREEAIEARKAEQLFLANMSHEIRTPLNAVIGMAHLLYDTSSSKEQIEYLNTLKHSANLLKGIINDILDISKIEAGKLEYNEEQFDLLELISSLKKTFELKVQGRPIEVFSEIDIRLKEAVILSDHLLLNQVLMNLLSNAEKFTDQGEIGIDLHLINENDEKMEVAFWVYDTGIGIENDRLDRIFEKYEQVNQKTKYKYGGTGLGLAITKKIVEFLGGTVDVQSEPKVGSLFVVTLSFKKGVNKLHTQQNLGVEPRFAHTEYKYVLVAEDNVMNRKYINEIFKNTPIEIDFAHNGAVAVEMCKNKKYDIILMDLQMPEKDGFEATIEIRTHENKNNSTPIVGLSAYATEEVKAKTTLVGMDWFISKPFTPKQLKSLLNIETTEQQRKEKPTQQDNVIDYQLLEELYFGDAEYAYEMFDHFLDVIDEQVDELQSALDNNIWEEGRRLVHKIKPGFSMVGLPHLQEIGTNLEKACEEKDLNTIKVLFEQLIDQLKADLPHVRREHQNLKLKIS